MICCENVVNVAVLYFYWDDILKMSNFHIYHVDSRLTGTTIISMEENPKNIINFTT